MRSLQAANAGLVARAASASPRSRVPVAFPGRGAPLQGAGALFAPAPRTSPDELLRRALILGHRPTLIQRGQGSSKGSSTKKSEPEVSQSSVQDTQVALFVLNKAFGDVMSFTLESNVVIHQEKGDFVEAYKSFHDGSDPQDAVGFTVVDREKSRREIHILGPAATFDATVHELVHHNASEAWNREFRGTDVVHEGVTQWLTWVALARCGLKEPSGVYMDLMTKLLETNDGIRDNLDVVLRAYFLGDEEAMNAPIGSVKKSLKQTVWFVILGDWEEPKTFDLSELLGSNKK